MRLTRLGPYEILKPVGKGGMGSVYEAVDSQTGLHVAVKALSPQLALAEGFRERFEAEIESLKTLRHEGIVRLYGYGEQDGTLFYSMELVRGTSLEDEIRAGRRFQWREVTDIAIQLCLALKHAHDHGIIHRDIKPANILVTPEDRVKLADFGIARLFGGTQLTTAGGVLGTADYMAPEQADGRPITARCDQYSLGGVLYALLTGRPPFRAKTLPEMLQFQRFAEPEPVRRFADQTPEQLESVVMQLLSKNPEDRFPNTQVLARHLQAMVRALSRPTADGFTLAEEELGDPPTTPLLGDSLSLAATQAEAVVEKDGSSSSAQVDSALSDPARAAGPQGTPTLAQEVANPAPKQRTPAPARVTPPAAPPRQPPAPSTHFITLEEEQAQIRNQHQRSWALLAIQLLVLVIALAGLAGLAIYLSRPKSADQLYASVMSRAAQDDAGSVRGFQKVVSEFLQRFPDDPRAADLQHYEQQLTLDRAERRLQLQARRNGLTDPSLLEIEVLYLKAVNLADQSPELALAQLRSLVELYGADADASQLDEDSPTGRQAICVELAKRRMEELHDALARQSARQLASLQERMSAADAMAASAPDRAAPMYRAIVDLYQQDPWAADIVATARRRLDELTSKQSNQEAERQRDRETN
jgi:eukaryotic-like serine/threonine-protein kinase